MTPLLFEAWTMSDHRCHSLKVLQTWTKHSESPAFDVRHLPHLREHEALPTSVLRHRTAQG